MIIQKQYKFYAAHRNEELHDKCRNLHGHRYGVTCFFEVERTGSYSTLFAEFDDKIEPFLKAEYDHAMLINVHDSLYQTLCDHMERTGECFRLKKFTVPTSVENLCHQLFTEITEMGFRLNRLEIRETDTSVVEYTREDWVADNRLFARLEPRAGVPRRRPRSRMTQARRRIAVRASVDRCARQRLAFRATAGANSVSNSYMSPGVSWQSAEASHPAAARRRDRQSRVSIEFATAWRQLVSREGRARERITDGRRTIQAVTTSRVTIAPTESVTQLEATQRRDRTESAESSDLRHWREPADQRLTRQSGLNAGFGTGWPATISYAVDTLRRVRPASLRGSP